MQSIRIALAVACAAGYVLWAQESRGSLAGRVADASGAVVSGAKISARNLSTNQTSSAESNSEGLFTMPYLAAGAYTVSVEASGFKRLMREQVEVRVGDRLSLDLTLELGAVQETVTVSGQAPVIESATATHGQVVDRRRISELPLADGSPLSLIRLAPGTVQTDFGRAATQPFSNSGISATVTNGAVGGNEYTLDGSPNTSDRRATGLRVAMVPPAEAVEEFKVVTASFDAQHGHSPGAVVDMAIKSGSNQFHGILYEFVRNDKFGANTFFLNRNPVARDSNGKSVRPIRRYNRYGGTLGGPVKRDRSFFFASLEGINNKNPSTNQFTVPTEALRQGNFAALLGQNIRIHDPASARSEGGRVVRDPFPGNVIPANRIDPIAANYQKFFPAANNAADAQGRNNFVGVNVSKNDYYAMIGRFDHSFTDRQKLFIRFSRNKRHELDENPTEVTNGIRATGFDLYRINNGGTIDYLNTLNATTVFNLRGGFSRFEQSQSSQSTGQFDPRTLGFSARTQSYWLDATGLPRFHINPFIPLGGQSFDHTGHYVYSIQPTVTRIAGTHSLRFGYDFRAYRENSRPNQDLTGLYQFGTDFTRLNDQTSSAAPIGQEYASFLLGLPTGGQFDRYTSRANQNLYHGVFIQDDWRIARGLTLNLGLRYEYESPATERYNRNLRSLDLATANPVDAAARAAYARAPIPEVPVANFRALGGPTFVTESDRGFWTPDRNNFMPRAGAAWQITPKTVLRGGVAWYVAPLVIEFLNQNGFASQTVVVPSNDNGLTFRARLGDAWPDGIVEPAGARGGLTTFLGRTVSTANDTTGEPNRTQSSLDQGNTRLGQSLRTEVSLQRELGANWVAEAAYIGTKGYDLNTSRNVNPVPEQYLSTAATRNPQTVSFLEATFANPFRGIEAARGSDFFTRTVLQRRQLVRPFPHFDNLYVRDFDGSSSYRSVQFRLEKRFSRGYTVMGNYSISRFDEKLTRLNQTDKNYEDRPSAVNVPHRVALSGIWEVPFGRGRTWGSNWTGVKELLLGGFQFQGMYQMQSGFPLTFGNIYYGGDIGQLATSINSQTIDRTFDTAGFYFNDAAVQRNGVVDPALQRNDARINLIYNLRTLPTRAGGFRGHHVNLVDLSVLKNFNFSERWKLQLRAEKLNAFNNVIFAAPELNSRSTAFGRITAQLNPPAEYQLGLRLLF